MGKRHTTDNSDGSEPESSHRSSTPAKRARVEDCQDDASAPRQHVKNKKGKSRKNTIVEEGEGSDEATLDAQLSANFSRVTADQDDDEFEAKNEAVVLDAISKREKKKGGIAQMGVIESIEMHQFMCHPRLSFKFGPQINFIIGHNGSGKSAVLSALTIALGGKAISTGRGNGLKSFIREGQSTSEVTISIKNQGEEAYKPDIYRDSIIVTRRFSKEGSSSYKIKSADGKIISTKRDELSAICDHMNIQVDNPMNILTQDAARQFLSASHPSDKYQFFLKGTQLTQLSEEYETCFENIGKTTRTLQLKREEIPDLEATFKEMDARNKEATKAREKQSQLATYRCELAWAHVKSKEDEMTKLLEDAAKARRRLPRIEQNIAEAEAAWQATGEKVEMLENERDQVPSIDSIKEELDAAKKEIGHNKEKIRDCRANEREMNQQMMTLSNEIAGFEAEIKSRANSEGNVKAECERAQQRLQAAQAECDAVKRELAEVADKPLALQKQLSQLRGQSTQTETDINRARGDIEAATGNIEQCRRRDGNDLRLFGNDLSTVLLRIRDETWSGEKPLGPFGLYVTVKDPKWATVMRIQLGQLMTSFAVTDNRDRHKLRQILDQAGNSFAQIIVSDVDFFDYSRGEPPEEVLTVLRALEIKDEYIKRILINQRSIEKVLLADTRSEGDRLLLRLNGGGLAWTGERYIVRRYPEGGATSSPMSKLPNQDPRHHMFTGADRTADIQRWEDEMAEAEKRLQASMSTQSAVRRQISELQLQYNKTNDRVIFLRRQVDKLEPEVVRLQQEAVVDAPVNIDFLEGSKTTALEEKKSIAEQFANVCKRRIALDEANVLLIKKRDELDQQVANWAAKIQDIKAKVASALSERVQATKHKEHWEQKLVEESTAVGELDQVVEVVQTEFQEWSAKAELIGPRVESPRRPEVIQRQIDSVQKVLAQHERQQGASPEEIAIQRDNAKLALEMHKRQIQEVSKLNKALKTSLALRMGKWVTFRQHIALRCKYQFQHHLWTRGYYGKVIFDHNAGTLNLKVQTDDQASTQSKDKDPKSLSGGEKSYSTICLLLALWESIQCPIRCLDEFDVFMDSVNRRISMKMMIETANASDKQYILITPQDMSHVAAIGETVRVHKMRDPERNQNTLSF